jgi:GDPmannose 4,6-dehydratase
MWQMLQQDEPEDFVLATGEAHSVREYVEKAFSHVDVKIKCALLQLIELYTY